MTSTYNQYLQTLLEENEFKTPIVKLRNRVFPWDLEKRMHNAIYTLPAKEEDVIATVDYKAVYELAKVTP